ncbi:MAG: DUF2127 domain-containing protein [Limisphaerales bacterium]
MRLFNGKWPHLAFKIGIVLKGLDGILEVIVGIALLVTSQAAIRKLIDSMTRGELLEDPNDFIANHLVHFFNHLSIVTKYFAALYLLGHGVIKTGLAMGLFFEKLWLFPVALVLLSLFILAQMFRLGETHSFVLAMLTIFDIAILILIWFEYRRLKSALHK